MTKHRLPTARRVQTSTALNAILSPPQREALKHQQVKEDKPAVAVRLAEVQQQLQQAEQKLEREKMELADLEKERARLIVDRLPIGEISDKVVQLEQSIEQGPSVIAVLQERLADLQKEQRQIERDHNVSLQKDAAHQQERLSQQLVNTLRAALDINTTLQACERNYIKLRETTGVETISANVTHGSDGSLQQLWETCRQELEGRRGIRPPVTVGQIPV